MPTFNGAISYAPFPEGFQGDMDETFQQSGQLATFYISGNLLTGQYLPPGSDLPTTDQGPIAMDGVWYFWDPVSGQYVPQTTSVKTARNYIKNPIYQVAQLGTTFQPIVSGATKTFDMATCRASASSVLSVSGPAGVETGPLATPDNDYCPTFIKYTVGPTLITTLAATDLYVHEHLIEGSDIRGIQGQPLSLSFSVYTNAPGNYSAYLTNFGRDMSYVFSFPVTVANQWTRIKITNIPPLPTGTGTWGGFAEGSTGLYVGIGLTVGSQWRTAEPKTWVAGFFAGTSLNTNLCAVLNNQFWITAVKLEASPTVTYLTANSFDQDFWESIRYYYTTFTYQSLTSGAPLVGNAHVANQCIFAYIFPRRMAKVPTVVPYGWVSHTAGNIYNASTSADFAVATLNATLKGISHTAFPTATAKADVFLTVITADARLA